MRISERKSGSKRARLPWVFALVTLLTGGISAAGPDTSTSHITGSCTTAIISIPVTVAALDPYLNDAFRPVALGRRTSLALEAATCDHIAIDGVPQAPFRYSGLSATVLSPETRPGHTPVDLFYIWRLWDTAWPQQGLADLGITCPSEPGLTFNCFVPGLTMHWTSSGQKRSLTQIVPWDFSEIRVTGSFPSAKVPVPTFPFDTVWHAGTSGFLRERVPLSNIRLGLGRVTVRVPAGSRVESLFGGTSVTSNTAMLFRQTFDATVASCPTPQTCTNL